MAFSLFGKRKPDSDTEDVSKDRQGSTSADDEVRVKRGFFDRMKQAVTRTRDSFSVGTRMSKTLFFSPIVSARRSTFVLTFFSWPE